MSTIICKCCTDILENGREEKNINCLLFATLNSAKQTNKPIYSPANREFHPNTWARNVRVLHTQLHCIAHLNNTEY